MRGGGISDIGVGMHRSFFWWAGLVLSALAITGFPSLGAKPDAAVSDFALIDHKGAFRQLYYYAKDPKTRAIVLFVQGNGCPLVRKQVTELKRLRDAYSTNGVVFWMVNANRQDSREEIAKEAAEFEIDMPILLDETQMVAKGLK